MRSFEKQKSLLCKVILIILFHHFPLATLPRAPLHLRWLEFGISTEGREKDGVGL